MRLPPLEMGQNEQIVDENDALNRACAATARRLALSYDTKALASEKITYSEEFGYIFRYEVSYVTSDDDGEIVAQLVLVVTSQDCKNFVAATYSKFELPLSG